MKKAKWIVVISILMVLFAQQVCANGFVPFASEEIYSATVSISEKKRVTYNVVVTNPSYKVHVNYCDLYRKAGTNTWEFVASMDDAIPSDTTGDMLVASDVSKYITKSGTYRVRACYTVGKSTVSRYSNERTFD